MAIKQQYLFYLNVRIPLLLTCVCVCERERERDTYTDTFIYLDGYMCGWMFS